MPQPEQRRLVNRIREERVIEQSPGWPGGWKGQLEAALLDSVFSVRARYGTKDSGVRAVVNRWRDERGEKLDDLEALAAYDGRPGQLITVLDNRQTLPGGATKAAAAAEAAQRLTSAGIRHARDVAGAEKPEISKDQGKEWRRVVGLGPVTWDYFLMLLGKPGVKADRMIVRFVGDALRRTVNHKEAKELVLVAAAELDCAPIELDHAIWTYQRKQ